MTTTRWTVESLQGLFESGDRDAMQDFCDAVNREHNAHAALVEALKNARFSLRTFRDVPQADQAWTTIDDDVMKAIDVALQLTER